MLELFVMSTCPYCKKVMNFMDENNFEYIKSDISNPDNYLKLLTLGGKEQVPFIVDHDNKDDKHHKNWCKPHNRICRIFPQPLDIIAGRQQQHPDSD